jgi:hypothetical protein
LKVFRWWRKLTTQKITLTDRDILIGLEPRNIKIEKEKQLDHIIQTTKWIIHANKQLGQSLSFNKVLGGIRYMMQIQKIIAIKNGRGEIYDEEWSVIENLLTRD